ncbi:hypothetical protein BURMUCF1_A0939 [Burkholderia multivorans ATCC BAA-247]|nr:hypothetical protein BURMUCF1_A0939 [Burkholderia multivorans ATCC BAA-247]
MPRRAASNGTRSSHRIITYVLLVPFLFLTPGVRRTAVARGARRRMH